MRSECSAASQTPESAQDPRRALYEQQVALLHTFLARGAISQAQFDKSYHDLTVKMGYGKP